VLLGTGTGAFAMPAPFRVGGNGQGTVNVATGGFDRDGHPDLAVLNLTDVSVLLGTGTGSFRPQTRVAIRSGGYVVRAVAVADFDRLRACVSELCEIQRAVVTLRMLDERPGEDVAMVLGISRGHVAVLLHRAKRALRACMT